MVEKKIPSLAWLRKQIEDVLAFTGFLKQHWRQIWSNNPRLVGAHDEYLRVKYKRHNYLDEKISYITLTYVTVFIKVKNLRKDQRICLTSGTNFAN